MLLPLTMLKKINSGPYKEVAPFTIVNNRILDDLVEACDPTWMQLEADFNPRGNVHTLVRVSHGKRQPC